MTAESGSGSAVQRFLGRLRHEVRNMLFVAVFFFISFSLLQLTKAAVLQKFDLHTLNPLHALVGALIVAKVLVIADAIPLVARYDSRPVVLAASWKTGFYLLLAVGFEFVDALVEHRHQGLREAAGKFGEEASTPIFWMLQAWLLILLFLFSAVRDLIRRLGRDRIREHFWGAPGASK